MCSTVRISFILKVVYQSFHVAEIILARNFSFTVININLDGVTYYIPLNNCALSLLSKYIVKIGELYMTIIRFFQ